MAHVHAWPRRQTVDAGSFSVEVFFTPPNTRASFHVHDETTVVLPLSGLFVENTFKASVHGEPGVAIVERPDSPHENIYSSAGGTNLRLRMAAELEKFVSFESGGQLGHVRAYAIAREMSERMSDPDPLLMECAGLEILGLVSHGPEWMPRINPRYLRDVVAGLRANVSPERGIAEIARDVDVPPIRLVRTFRKAYGISLARFLRTLQMQRALELLRDPTRSISDVAAEAGFSDQSHMTRAFTQTYGLPPAVLRRSGRFLDGAALCFYHNESYWNRTNGSNDGSGRIRNAPLLRNGLAGAGSLRCMCGR
ncbi:MAG TPA: helix-turn-helix transcriptional regulator [Candidatus Baltobacteraceae bacterium]|nr:helix-turn-helix transcriptional regulator [Candidatus Baltobacteraceae bacterium]